MAKDEKIEKYGNPIPANPRQMTTLAAEIGKKMGREQADWDAYQNGKPTAPKRIVREEGTGLKGYAEHHTVPSDTAIDLVNRKPVVDARSTARTPPKTTPGKDWGKPSEYKSYGSEPATMNVDNSGLTKEKP